MSAESTKRRYKFMTRDAIKYLAMIMMLTNHIVNIFPLPWNMLNFTLISIGYFTGFVMIYFLVEGYYHTYFRKNTF